MIKFRMGLISLFLIILYLTGCEDNPVSPAEVTDYKVYYWRSQGDYNLFTYHTKSFEFDSFMVAYDASSSISVSADGSLLYFSNQDSTTVVNSETLEYVRTIPYFCHLYNSIKVSPSGDYIAIPGQELVILETNNYTEIFKDSSNNYDGQFSSDSKFYYYGNSKIELNQSSGIKSNLNLATIPFTSRPSINNNFIYLYLNDDVLFYDLLLDSVVQTFTFSPGLGDIIESKLTDKIFVSAPGNFSSFETKLEFYAIDKNSYQIDTIKTDHIIDNNSIPFEPSQFSITPDGRYLMILSPIGEPPFRMIQYDILKKEIVNFIPDMGGWIYTIDIQKDI